MSRTFGFLKASCCVSLAVGSLLTCGCDAPSEAVVQGKILLNGQPLVVEQSRDTGEGMVVIELVSLNSTGGLSVSERAIYDSLNGTFIVPGKRGKGISAGEYKIVVLQLKNFAEPHSDLLRGKFAEEHTPLRCHATLGETSIVEVELSQY